MGAEHLAHVAVRFHATGACEGDVRRSSLSGIAWQQRCRSWECRRPAAVPTVYSVGLDSTRVTSILVRSDLRVKIAM